jgi:hypothetical protein
MRKEHFWEEPTPEEVKALAQNFSPRARSRGIFPCGIKVMRVGGEVASVAMNYKETGKWERWSFQLLPPKDISMSWSRMLEWIRPVIGDRACIEIFPREEEIVNTAPVRWFWIVQDEAVLTECSL